ncbi:protoporphyrinogen oxidase HemJ [Hansschlegelia plantiphila]|uniref:Protoporphyrinogen IX oxidase n=1 Tax=Hansschlegelia plantiphila TaxID=374655 RepID=A0A9W6MW77_9HYPH|nr:protoporphyrinogen oxidase HemJ [Hansschlegelia plantiphila]GLK68773.1 membrane protein [Hansschlegelia plantiphila]
MDPYLWIKTLHVVAVISWMAAMLYLPRLFVYHAGAAAGSELSETFKVMERRLLRGIATPAMIVSWIAGLLLVWKGGWMTAGWLHGKLLFVVILSGIHGMLARFTRDFANDRNRKTAKFYRVLNEVPAVLMLAIVALVIIKPF